MLLQDTETELTLSRLGAVESFRHKIQPVEISRTALLVIDMQRIFSGLWTGGNAPNLNRFDALISFAQSLGCLIVRTQHGHVDPRRDGGMLQNWWGSSIICGSPQHAFMKGFEPGPNDLVIPKNRYSAFLNTALKSELEQRRINTLIIGGVMTNLCCETTARDAFCHDFSVIFLADGTATASEAMHRATLLNLAFGFAHILSCRQTAAWLGAESHNPPEMRNGSLHERI